MTLDTFEEEHEDTTCPARGVDIADPRERKQHLDGLDSSRLEYPRQDVERIAALKRGRSTVVDCK